jgi:hypothetical protein
VAFSTLEKILLGYVGLDIVKAGSSRTAVLAAVNKLIPKGATAAPVAGRPIGGMQAFRLGLGPTALGAGYYYTALAAQDQARRDLEQYGEPRIPIPLYNPLLGDMPTVPVPEVIVKAIRKPSKFNKAISAGMKAVRSSKFMGKPKSISNSKKAFATVTKTVSALKKGRKRPTKGVRGTIARAVRRYI